MANRIILKKSSVVTEGVPKVPLPTDLEYGELAINYAVGKLYFKDSTNTIRSLGDIGFTGSQGTTGFTGSQGAQGIQGYTGSSGAGGGSFTFSDTAPSSPSNGDEWLHSTTGVKYTYVDDGSSAQWAEIESDSASTGGGGGGGTTSVYSAEYSLQGTTSNATETEIFIGGVSGQRIDVASGTSLAYTVEVSCRRTDATGDYGSWFIKGVVINNAGTVSDVGTLYEVVVARTDASMIVDIRADDTNNSLGVYVTGATGKTVSWKAVVTAIEV